MRRTRDKSRVHSDRWTWSDRAERVERGGEDASERGHEDAEEHEYYGDEPPGPRLKELRKQGEYRG